MIMIKKNKIHPGDLVIWANEAQSGKILEVGVVLSLKDSVPNDNMSPMKGARIIWESGVYWSPLEQIVKVDEGEYEIST